MRKLLPAILLFFLFQFLSFQSFICAQKLYNSQNIRFKNISIEQGLSQSTVNCIIQDNRGFMWFGTQDGLNCYNGRSFKKYKSDLLDSNTISSSNITCLFEGRNGILWIGTTSGLNFYTPQTGVFKSYKHDPENPKTISSNKISCVYQDRKNMLWVGTKDGGLNVLNPETKEIKDYKNEKYNKTCLSDNEVNAICEDRNGFLWIATGNGLSVYNPETQRFSVYKNDPTDEASLLDNRTYCVAEMVNGLIYVGTHDGLSVLNPETQKFTNYKTHNNLQSSNRISSVYEDRGGKVWVGTYEDGVCIFDQASKIFTCYTSNLNNSSSIGNNNVKSIYEDRTGTIWIGTWGKGLSSYNPHFDRFVVFQKTLGVQNSLSSDDISSACEDSDGNLWIGTFSDGLNRYDPGTGKYTHFSTSTPNHINNNSVYTLLDDDENNVIWVGTSDGLNAVSLGNKKTIIYKNNPKDNQSISFNDINCLYKDRSGALWIGTQKGLNAMNIGLGKFRRYFHEKNNNYTLSNDYITSICEDIKGTMWIGTIGGLNALNPQTGEITRYRHEEGNPQSLSNDIINHIYEDKAGTLWIASYGGLNVFKPETKSFEYFTERDGLPNNLIYGIVEDNNHNLWLSTNNGICRFSLEKNSHAKNQDEEKTTLAETNTAIIKKYDTQDGLPSNEFNGNAFYAGKSGALYFGGLAGLIAFHPDSLADNPHVSPVYLTSFKLFDKEYLIDSVISFKKAIKLDYDQHTFSFDFVTLNFITPEKNQYAYMLEGWDKEWILGNFARYSNVDPGEYVFRVKASNNDGKWNEEGTSIKIIIHPPWWQTPWAYFSAFLVIVSSIIGIIRWREQSLTIQKKILEKKVAERTRQLKKEKDRVEEAYLQIDSKNKEITDSIKYAKRLQEAILTPENEVKQYLPESFILYKPKDIVSGDFYYFNKTLNNHLIIAAVDCTGHGVPGAFMSIVGNNLFNQSVNDHKKIEPAEILDELNKGLSETLRQTLTEASVKDGMDVALCVLEQGSYLLHYAGAYNPLWIVRENILDSDLVLHERAHPIDKDLLEIRADKFPVGKFLEDKINSFTNHQIQLKKGDTFYIFSDGYPDQFGGEKGKKFKYKRFRDLFISIREKSMEEQKEILDKTIESWRGDMEQVDDILVIGVRLT